MLSAQFLGFGRLVMVLGLENPVCPIPPDSPARAGAAARPDDEPEPTTQPASGPRRTVVVVGGGPAGMEAASQRVLGGRPMTPSPTSLFSQRRGQSDCDYSASS
jgi:hypothetical protein